MLARLVEEHKVCLSAIVRAEVLCGMRQKERVGTVEFLDACETVPVSASIADRAAGFVRMGRKAGKQITLPDALIAATAIDREAPLFTCNTRHMDFNGLDIRLVNPGG